MRGESTFCIEMAETSSLLSHAQVRLLALFFLVFFITGDSPQSFKCNGQATDLRAGMRTRLSLFVLTDRHSAPNNALQPSSLVVLDELGRGTATHDGYAVAYAVLTQLTRHNRCRWGPFSNMANLWPAWPGG